MAFLKYETMLDFLNTCSDARFIKTEHEGPK